MKIALSLSFLVFCFFTNAQEIKFTDPLFEKLFLFEHREIDLNNNGIIEFNETEKVEKIDLFSPYLSNANDVIHFKKIKKLVITKTPIKNFSIDNLEFLKEIIIENTELTKIEISNLPSLKKLVLSNNQIDSFSIDNFEFLEEITIVNNKLTKIEISNLPSLKILRCNENQIKDIKITNCPNFENLFIDDNQIEEIDLSQLKELEVLSICKNRLKELNLSNNSELIKLYSVGNEFKSIDIKKNLKLDMESVYVDKDVKIIGTIEQLEKYVPSQHIKFSDPIFKIFIQIYHHKIDLNENKKIEFSETEQVEELDLSGLNLTNTDDIIHFKKIKKLVITKTPIKNFSIDNFEFLEEITIDNNKLTKIEISNLPSLKILRCDENQTLTKIEISNLPSLKTLLCYKNQIKDIKITNCPNIEYFYIADNQIEEIDLSKLKELKDISIDKNRLKVLNISNNLELEQFSIEDNDLKSIDIKKNLKLDMKNLYLDKDVKIIGTVEQLEKYVPGEVIINEVIEINHDR